MSSTVDNKKLEDIIIDLARRLRRLETGGKPLAGNSTPASGLIALAAGADITGLAATLSWVNPNVRAVMGAVPYFKIYVDNDNNDAYLWPSGASLSSGQKNLEVVPFLDLDYLQDFPYQARFRMYMKNRDSGAHNYYVYVGWTYSTGGSGSA
jgi:hypothetical protein